MLFEARTSGFEDSEGRFPGRRLQSNYAEATLQCLVRLDMATVFTRSCATNAGYFTSPQCAFETFVGISERTAFIDAALEHRMNLIDEQDELRVLGQNFDQILHALLVLPHH